jgi:hypothetical protein
VPGSLRIISATLATGVAMLLSGCGLASSPSAAPADSKAPAPTSGSAQASPGAQAASPVATASATAGPLAVQPLTLQDDVALSGYDAATDASGRAYVAWIGDAAGKGRKIHLCTLPPGATSCLDGIQVIDLRSEFSPTGLRVLVAPGGKVTLVWFHDTVASENGPQGSEIAIATSQAGDPLSRPKDVATAPSFGFLLDATAGPGGSIWVVSTRTGDKSVQVRPGLTSAPVKVATPFPISQAQLRFSGSTAVLAISKDGSISDPVSYASERGGSWTGFRTVAHTWTSGGFGMAATPSGIRLIATVDSASYYPVVSQWAPAGFSPATPTGDLNACAPTSHDVVSDASGRLADASSECGDVAVADLPDTAHATVARFPCGGTFAGGTPQLTTTPSGRAWVVWSIESSVSDKLMVAPLLLPGSTP